MCNNLLESKLNIILLVEPHFNLKSKLHIIINKNKIIVQEYGSDLKVNPLGPNDNFCSTQKIMYCVDNDEGNIIISHSNCSEKCWFYFMMLGKNKYNDVKKYAIKHIGKCSEHNKYVEGFL